MSIVVKFHSLHFSIEGLTTSLTLKDYSLFHFALGVILMSSKNISLKKELRTY